MDYIIAKNGSVGSHLPTSTKTFGCRLYSLLGEISFFSLNFACHNLPMRAKYQSFYDDHYKMTGKETVPEIFANRSEGSSNNQRMYHQGRWQLFDVIR